MPTPDGIPYLSELAAQLDAIARGAPAPAGHRRAGAEERLAAAVPEPHDAVTPCEGAMTDLPRRQFALDSTVRSDLARRLLELVAEQWARRGVAPVRLAYYARVLSTDVTNVGRSVDRLVTAGWLVDEQPAGPRWSARHVAPGPRWVEESLRPRERA